MHERVPNRAVAAGHGLGELVVVQCGKDFEELVVRPVRVGVDASAYGAAIAVLDGEAAYSSAGAAIDMWMREHQQRGWSEQRLQSLPRLRATLAQAADERAAIERRIDVIQREVEAGVVVERADPQHPLRRSAVVVSR